MKQIPALLVLAAVLVAAGCVSEGGNKTIIPEAAGPREEVKSDWQIKDYQESAAGRGLPSWVTAFLDGGNPAVEALEEYQDRYVFVAMNRGANFRALEQWRLGFSPELDFPRLAAIRIENRFLSVSSGFPDADYGAYYETLIRAASDASWSGVIREGDYWVRREFAGQPSALQDRETYDFLIINTIEKSLLASQVNTLLQSITPDPPLSRDQSAAVNRIRERFFEGF
ncbi:MAG: hypothetical protein LBS48_03935 [Treponema sp.]|jgi:hypothetical protein|nr:hypothetical protein [Treponema sp.]